MSESTAAPMASTTDPGSSGAAPASGADALLAVMEAYGVRVAFGIVSVHNLPLVDGIVARSRWVPVRHEAAAVNAADGAARATGGLGLAVTSTGTGAGNAAGSMIEALAAGSSVLHVTGQIDSPWLGIGGGFIHETRDQLGMLTAVSKAAASIDAGHDAHASLDAAARIALSTPTGPVSVEWPIDLQYTGGAGTGASAFGAPAGVPAIDEDALDRAVALIASARRPLVWAGGGAVGARDEVAALLERLQTGLVTSNAGRGTIDETDDRVVGNYAAMPAGQALLDRADLLISIGTHFRSNETRTYKLRIPTTHIQIDVDPAAPGRTYPCDVGLVGDAAAVLRALVDRLESAGGAATEADWLERVRAARVQAREDQRAGLGPQAHISDAIRAVLPPDGIIARDVTIPSSSWGNRLLDIHDPRTNLFARGGGIGQGLAMGLGGTVATGRPGVVIVGDGGLAVHLGELLTVSQEQPDLCVIVFNDGGYGVLRNMQDAQVGRRSGVDLTTPTFATLANAVGLPFRRVTDAGHMRAELDAALSVGGASLLEVDVTAIGAMPVPFSPPVDIPSAVSASGSGDGDANGTVGAQR